MSFQNPLVSTNCALGCVMCNMVTVGIVSLMRAKDSFGNLAKRFRLPPSVLCRFSGMRFICCAFLLLFSVPLTSGYQFASQSLQLRRNVKSGVKLHQPVASQLQDDTNLSVEDNFDYGSELRRTGLWVAAAAGFAGVIGATKGVDSAVEFCSGYLLEQCLSVDNLFVFIVLFEYFKISKDKQDRVLSYGIWGGKIYGHYFVDALSKVTASSQHAIERNSYCASRYICRCWSCNTTAISSSIAVIFRHTGILII